MNRIFKSGLILAVAVLVSCNKGDMEFKKLQRGEGIWKIESLTYDYYNSTGTAVDSTIGISDPGELVFFRSETTNALFDHHLVVANMNQSNGTITANPGDVYFDGDRAYLGEDPDVNHNFPDILEGLWTVQDDGRKEQVWTMVSTPNGPIAIKITMVLKKK